MKSKTMSAGDSSKYVEAEQAILSNSNNVLDISKNIRKIPLSNLETILKELTSMLKCPICLNLRKKVGNHYVGLCLC